MIADLTGHGYWHILAGYGAYLGFTCGVCKSNMPHINNLIKFELEDPTLTSPDLILAAKNSPGTYDYDASARFPSCYRVESASGAIRLEGEKA